MFKTMFKMFTTRRQKPLFEWVFDIFYKVFDNFLIMSKYTICFIDFTDYTKRKVFFVYSAMKLLLKFNNVRRIQKNLKLLLKM